MTRTFFNLAAAATLLLTATATNAQTATREAALMLVELEFLVSEGHATLEAGYRKKACDLWKQAHDIGVRAAEVYPSDTVTGVSYKATMPLIRECGQFYPTYRDEQGITRFKD